MEIARSVGIVYETDDYSVFIPLRGNRTIDEYRKSKIRESVKRVGWIKNPIVVNENFEVIDGQARLEVLKELGLPVQYIFAYGTGIDECISMNISQSNWRTSDYISSYAALGNQNYARLTLLMDNFEELGVPVISGVARNTIVRSGNCSRNLKSGNFVLSEQDYTKTSRVLNEVKRFLPLIANVPGSSRVKITAIAWVIRNTSVNLDRLYKRLEKSYPLLSPVVETRPDIFFSELSDIYNKGLSAKNCIYLDNEYKRFERESSTE